MNVNELEMPAGDSPESESSARELSLKIPSIPEMLLVLLFTGGFLFAVTVVFFVVSVYVQMDTEIMLLESLIIIPAFLYVKFRGYSISRVFRFNSITRQQLTASVVIGISLVVMINSFEGWMETIPKPEWYSGLKSQFESGLVESLSVDGIYSFVILFLSVVVFAAVFEEMLFRGFIQQSFENRISPAMAIALTAVMFSILHPFGFLPILLLAVVLGFLSMASNSVFPAIVIHALNNGISLFALNRSDGITEDPAQGIGVPFYIAALALVALYFSLKYYYTISKHQGGKQHEHFGD